MDEMPVKNDYARGLMLKAAWYYYVEEYTQQRISELLGISRAKVMSLLEGARRTGVVRFHIRQDGSCRMALERELMTRFGLKDVFLVPRADTLTELSESLAQAAAMYILSRTESGSYINMGYGHTTSLVLGHLATASAPINVVSLTGGVNYYLPNFQSDVFNTRLYLAPSPLLLSSGALRDALRQESDVEEVFRMVPLSSMSVVGIGSMDEQATIIQNGVMNKNEFTVLRLQGAVGDVLCHFLDKDGNLVSEDLEARLMSTPAETLRQLDNVIGVAGGPEKANAILAALRGGFLDILITDEGAAEKLLA